jgi:hypothetical protein
MQSQEAPNIPKLWITDKNSRMFIFSPDILTIANRQVLRRLSIAISFEDHRQGKLSAPNCLQEASCELGRREGCEKVG